MEFKTYVIQTTPINEYYLETLREEIKVKTLSGKIRNIHNRSFSEEKYFSMYIGRKNYDFKYDEVCKKIEDISDVGDVVSIEYFYPDGLYFAREIISFTNQTKEIKVLNQVYTKAIEHQEKNKLFRQLSHDILHPVIEESKYVAILFKTEENSRKLVDLIGFLDDVCAPVNRMLEKNGITPFFDDNMYVLTYTSSIFYKVPDSNYEIYVCQHTNRKKDCSFCGTESYNNHSLIVSNNYYCKDYYCENCFFEKLSISIPESFVRDYNSEEHIKI